jgi:hypothetical protein
MATARYQSGSITLKKRAKGLDVREFRWRDDGGKQRSKLLGTTAQYPTEKAAHCAADAFRIEINSELPARAAERGWKIKVANTLVVYFCRSKGVTFVSWAAAAKQTILIRYPSISALLLAYRFFASSSTFATGTTPTRLRTYSSAPPSGEPHGPLSFSIFLPFASANTMSARSFENLRFASSSNSCEWGNRTPKTSTSVSAPPRRCAIKFGSVK